MSSRPEPITYALTPGDNLFQLSRAYKTTVLSILAENPGVDPYDLPVGECLRILPGEPLAVDPGEACPDPALQFKLLSDMRNRWEQHVFWTRLFLISVADRLADLKNTESRLMQNPKDIAGIFSAYYTAATAMSVEQLLTEHLQIGGALMIALRDQKTMDAEKLRTEWYQNAGRMADAFSGINPYFRRGELYDMLSTHLDLTTREVAARLSGDYKGDVAAFDSVEEEALSMADYFSVGIMRQFPQRFCQHP